MTRLLVILLLFASGCTSTEDPTTTGPDDPPVVERDLEGAVLHFISNSGQPSLKPGTYVVDSQAAFNGARRENPNLPEKYLALPEGVDFAAVRLAVLAPELSSGSARLKFAGVRIGPKGYLVRYRVDQPAGDRTADMAYPALLVEIPKDAHPVAFEKVD